MDIDLASYKVLYLSSARENVQGMIQAVKNIQQGIEVQPAIEALFVKSHTLKGQSMTMGHTGIAKTALAIERYMRLIREQQKVPDAADLAIVMIATEKIAVALMAIEQNDQESSMSEVITKLEQQLGVKV